MHNAVALERLWIGHWPKNGAGQLPVLAARGFLVETCLRRMLITTWQDAPRGPAAPPQVFAGASAYRFLLEVATGLNSAVPGETNVFGQFKRAWEAYRCTAERDLLETLTPVIARVVHDTRAIRQRHLQNIGGASYGSLARRLLRADNGDRVLFVGAGDLARSMLPFFRSCRVGTWSRRLPGAVFTAAGQVFAPDAGREAAKWAQHVVMTTPADPNNDGRWAEWIEASLVQTVLHFGRRHGERMTWPAHAVAYDLDDIFNLRRSQDTIRSLQLERARATCRDLAQELSCLTIPSAPRLAAG